MTTTRPTEHRSGGAGRHSQLRPTDRRTAGPRSGHLSRRRIVIAVGIVVVLLAFVTVFATSGGKPGASIAQNRPVSVTGAALTPLPEGATGPDAAVGLAAPLLAGAAFDGAPVSTEAGSPTLVIVLAHWCPHCRAEVPRLVEWAAAGRMPTGVSVVGVATATDPDLPNYPPSQWLDKAGFPWPVIADTATGSAATALGVTGFPFFVMIDAQGKVAWRASGELEMATLTAMIDGALVPS